MSRRERHAFTRYPALLAVVLALAAVFPEAAHAKKRKAPPRKLGLSLRVHPQAGIAPLDVRAVILVLDPERILDCPVYSILWTRQGDTEAEGKSGFAGDVACGPNGPLIHAPRPRPIRLYRPGEWVIHASMADHGLTLHDRQTVQVIGRGEE